MKTHRQRLKTFFATSTVIAAFLSSSLILSAASNSANENWPQWRGPLSTGVAPDANPPTNWSESNNIKWKVKLPGRGNATPIVWGNQVFIQTAIGTGQKVEGAAEKKPEPAPAPADASGGNGGRRRQGPPGGGMNSEKPHEKYQFVLLCLDRQTGKTLWQKVAREEVPHEGHHPDHGFSSYSPVTDGKNVIAYFGSRGIYCYDLDGNLKWSKDLGHMQTKMAFGEGSSPALFGDTIIINWDHEAGSFIVALDKKDGHEIWRQRREEGTSWASPIIVDYQGKPQVITDASNKVRSYDLATGKIIWECTGLTANVIPSPVADKDTVYSMSGFKGNALLAIKLGRTGDLTGTDAIAWSHNKATPYVPSPLLYDDKLYFFAGNNGMLSCFDSKSGKPLIDAERLEEIKGVYASPAGAANRVYLVGRNGAVMVIKNSDKLEVIATNKLDEEFDASPAIVGKDLFLRGKESLYCIAEK
jgi:outer membrane protein assembly factor BamB